MIRAVAASEIYVVNLEMQCLLMDNIDKQSFFRSDLLTGTKVTWTDFHTPEKGCNWHSHKVKKSAVHYEIALGIKTDDICLLGGKYPP